MTQTRSKRAIWWRSENAAACRELTLGLSFAIAGIALVAVPILLALILPILGVFILDKVESLLGFHDTPMLIDIAMLFTIALIVPIVVVWINIPVVTLYLFKAIRWRWTGILPTLFTGLIFGLIWGEGIFLMTLYESQPSVLSDLDFYVIVSAGVLHAGFVWLVMRGMFPQAYQRPAAK